MYLWKIERLKKDIKEGRLSEQDRFRYMMIYIAVGALFLEAAMYAPLTVSSTWDYINSLVNIAMPIIGAYVAYRANGAGQGADFLGRFFSVSLVVSIRVSVFVLPVLIGFFIYYYSSAFSEGEELLTTPLEVAVMQIWHAFVYFRIWKHISELTTPTDSEIQVNRQVA